MLQIIALSHVGTRHDGRSCRNHEDGNSWPLILLISLIIEHISHLKKVGGEIRFLKVQLTKTL